MKWTRYLLLMPVLMVQALSSCSLIDEPEYDDDNNDSVKASLAFIVSGSSGSSTRQSEVVVQEQGEGENGRRYRGLDLITLIPFSKQGEIVKEDRPLRMFDVANATEFPKPSGDYGAFYLYRGYTMMRGTASFLAYGKAPVPEGGSKTVYGSLQENIPATQLPAEISFSPDGIWKVEAAPAAAGLLADYLTYIANAQTTEGLTTIKWANTTNSQLRAFYLNFTGQENDKKMLMAGSSANVMAHVNALYDNISNLTFSTNTVESRLRGNILERIKTYAETVTTSGLTLAFDANDHLTDVGVDYPSSVGLPDGAAALLWMYDTEKSVYRFMPQVKTTTTANMNTITRYCYPAALYYYANSQIDTSNKENIESYYYSQTSPTGPDEVLLWSEVLDKYENTSSIVTGNTTSVAIQDPLHYAVARLKMTMQAETASLVDAYGKTVTLTDKGFPLTGVIVSSQRPVGFDFKPLEVTGESHAGDSFIYDSQMMKSSNESSDGYYYLGTSEQPIPSTLVLQSYDDEEVTIIFEFLNKIEDFHSKTGIIYKGTKFYLIGKIKPEVKENRADYEERVFTRDFVTEVNMKVRSTEDTKSLENAYNVLPDILGGRLEVSVEMTPKWYFATPTVIVLD